jgi:hypothetical protein
MMTELLTFLGYILPGVLVALGALYVMKHQASEEQKRRLFEFKRSQSENSLNIRLQAYERLTLFLSRNTLSKLVLRIPPGQHDTSTYLNQLIQTIEQEFDHNVSQQIYVSAPCWDLIVMAKNKTILKLRAAGQNDWPEVSALRATLVAQHKQEADEMTQALDYLNTEVSQMW